MPRVVVAVLLHPTVPREGPPPFDADVLRDDATRHDVELRAWPPNADEDVDVAARPQVLRLAVQQPVVAMRADGRLDGRLDLDGPGLSAALIRHEQVRPGGTARRDRHDEAARHEFGRDEVDPAHPALLLLGSHTSPPIN